MNSFMNATTKFDFQDNGDCGLVILARSESDKGSRSALHFDSLDQLKECARQLDDFIKEQEQ